MRDFRALIGGVVFMFMATIGVYLFGEKKQEPDAVEFPELPRELIEKVEVQPASGNLGYMLPPGFVINDNAGNVIIQDSKGVNHEYKAVDILDEVVSKLKHLEKKRLQMNPTPKGK